MSQNQTEPKPADVEQESGKGLDGTPCCASSRLRERTPEVQAHLDAQTHTYSPSVNPELARRLEDQRNVARVVAADAIREIERILETGDTYCTREIVANLKEALTPGSFLHNDPAQARRPADGNQTDG